MRLQVSISNATAAWLGRKAESAGTDSAEIAARVLENAAQQDVGENGDRPVKRAVDWLREFDGWTSSLPGRGGRADTRTESIYE